jgi:dTDP-4-dehydrorhamnose reductase
VSQRRSRRVLVFGSSGRLGRGIVEAARAVRSPAAAREPSWELHPRGDVPDLRLAGSDPASLSAALAARLAELRPRAVLNCAAMSLVDDCERRRDEAHAVNALFPGLLGAACAKAGVPLVQLSTDYVFGDETRCGPGPYREDSPCGPCQCYGESKLDGERLALAAREAGGIVSVVRVSWLFAPWARPFEEHVRTELARGDGSVRVAVRQASRPISIRSLSRWLLALCGFIADRIDDRQIPDLPPFLHPSGGPFATRADWARVLLEAWGLLGVRILDHGETYGSGAAASSASPPRARRPLDSRLDGRATASWARQADLPRMRDWREEAASLARRRPVAAP